MTLLLRAMVLIVLLGAAPAFAHPSAAASEYRWVEAPTDLDTGIEAAAGRTAEVPVPLLEAGAADVWTPDLQAVLTLRTPGAVTSPATVTIAPLAPADLPATPRPLLANGNAYRVEVSTSGWSPDASTIVLKTPFPAATVWRLDPDGTWVDLAVAAGPDGLIRAPVAGDGVYLAATTSTDGHDDWWEAVTHLPLRPTIAAMGLVGALVAWRRHRSGYASPEEMPGARQRA